MGSFALYQPADIVDAITHSAEALGPKDHKISIVGIIVSISLLGQLLI